MLKIDFVIPWVDGSDPEWQKLFNQYAPVKKSVPLADYTAEKRYKEYGLLRYWFRCIEKNASWVNKVFFITNGQKPDWLNVNYEKLVWVKHEDYIAWLSILKQGYKAYGLNEDLARYRISANSISANKKRSAMWTWNIYRNTEKLSMIESMYYFSCYLLRSVIKHYF